MVSTCSSTKDKKMVSKEISDFYFIKLVQRKKVGNNAKIRRNVW